jgi:cytochrome c oxidase subunit 2
LVLVALAGILVWGFVGVDRGILEELSGEVRVLEPRFVVARSPGPEQLTLRASRGEELFSANGCGACHSIDGGKKIGPSLLGIWGEEQVLDDGTVVVVDERYFRTSVLQPQAQIVEGFDQAAMPSYEGLLDSDDLAALSAYVASLRQGS